MECEHNFQFGDVICFSGIGSCDGCGSPQCLESTHMRYIGEDKGHHFFEVLTQFSCPGCHKTVDCYHLTCGDMDVTEEFKREKTIKE